MSTAAASSRSAGCCAISSATPLRSSCRACRAPRRRAPGLAPIRPSRSPAAARPRAILKELPATPGPNAAERRLQVIGLISALADVQAQVASFEVFAGRSAMVGVMVALVAELVTERGLFSGAEPAQLAALAGAVAAAVAAAAAAAAAGGRGRTPPGAHLMEAVLSSLTASARSAGSVTGKQVDRAVDYILSRAFSGSVISSLIEDEHL